MAVGVHTRRQLDLPVVVRNHHAAPRLAEEQGREALSLGLELQVAAQALAPEQAEDLRLLRRRHIVRLAALAYTLEAGAGLATGGAVLGWWPNPLV